MARDGRDALGRRRVPLVPRCAGQHRERLAAGRTGADPYDLLTAGRGRVEPGAEGLIFLPYLTGERCPHPDPNARGAFVGLTLRHGKAHMVRAVLEGVSFGLRDSLEMIKALGVPIEQVRASGGGARSPLWRQIQADVFGTELVLINVTEGAAFGAALLAGVGVGGVPGRARGSGCMRAGGQQHDAGARSGYCL